MMRLLSSRVCGDCVVFLVFLHLPSKCLGQNQTLSPTSAVPQSTIGQLSDGTILKNLYHNTQLGFQYEFPSGWVVSDQKVQQQAIADAYQFVWTEDILRKQKPQNSQCAKALLFVSKYPELMRTSEFNPFALMIAADPECIPGATFPTNTKDQSAIQRIALNLGAYFKTVGINSLEPGRVQAFQWAGRVVFQVHQRFRVNTHGAATMAVQEVVTSTLVVPTGRYWVMSMFVAGDDSQLHQLLATKFLFDTPQPEATSKATQSTP